MADTIMELPVVRAFQSGGTSAKLVLLNNRPTVRWDAINQEILFQGILTDKYLGGNVGIKFYWLTNPYVAGNTIWEYSFKRLSAGVDFSSTTYNATKTLTVASAGLNLINISTITFTNGELGYSVGALDELFQLKVRITTLVATTKIHLLNLILENV